VAREHRCAPTRGQSGVRLRKPQLRGLQHQNILPRAVDRAALPATAGIKRVVRAGAELGARVIAVESVRGAATAGRRLFEALAEEVRDQYAGQMWVFVNAMHHGVCQDRPRLFWVLAAERFEMLFTPTTMPTLTDALAGLEKW